MSDNTGKWKHWSNEQLMEILESFRTKVVVKLRLLRPSVGGQPAGDKGLEAFIEHHLNLDPRRGADKKPTNPEFLAAFERIKHEELGEKDTTPETGEVEEKRVYGVNVVRKDERGPYLLEHQVKAMLKQAASRIGIFSAKLGSKGDLAELGTVVACGDSLQDPKEPWKLYWRKDGAPAATSFDTMRGSVSTAQGRKSIQYEAERVMAGGEVEFELRWPPQKLLREDVVKVFAATLAIGLGSALSLGNGRFEYADFRVCEEPVANLRPEKAKKGRKKDKADDENNAG